MNHRGPDDHGVELTTCKAQIIGLGAARLAIQDLSPRGRQPMLSGQSGNVIVFNGELYNVHELRRQLQSLGYAFRGDSDTEVMLAAYDVWGRGCVARFRGMFTLAIFDRLAEEVFFARDPMGIKPLYYRHAGDVMWFASEIRTLLAARRFEGRLSLPGMHSYLATGAVSEPRTILEGVHMLEAGHYAVLDSDGFRQTRYWSLDEAFLSGERSSSRQRAAEKLRDLLEKAVDRHLISDVPIGVFLSGGIDSTVMAALAARASEEVRTVAVVFPQQELSEQRYSDLASRHLGTVHSTVELDGATLSAEMPGALNAMDQPTVDGVNTFIVSKAASAKGLKVVLSGLGADELFAGYPTFRNARLLKRLRTTIPKWLGPSAGRVIARRAKTEREAKLVRWLQGEEQGLSAYDLLRELFSRDSRSGLSTQLMVCDGWSKGPPPHLDDINGISYLELSRYMRNTLLRDSDVMSMSHSLELRVPFLDLDVVSFVAGLPGHYKTAGRRPKPLLVEAVGDLLPAQIVERRKVGFTLPYEIWLRDALGARVGAALSDAQFGGQAALALNGDAVRGVWEQFQAGGTDWLRPWSLFVLKDWADRHLPT